MKHEERDVTQTKDVATIENFSASLPVTKNMLNALSEQRQLLREFVRSELVENVDFGTIPKTPKPTLYKPGAEKLRGLFGLSVKLECTHREIDRKDGFAMFTYKATVLRGEQILAECEGSMNSLETKNKNRNLADLLNSMQKMAQKRAFVGAIIIAVGASDFFTQDIEDVEDAKNLGVIPSNKSSVPNVTGMSSRPKENVQAVNDPGEYVIPFGKKFLGKKIKDIPENELAGFINWLEQGSAAKGTPLSFEVVKLKEAFEAFRDGK